MGFERHTSLKYSPRTSCDEGHRSSSDNENVDTRQSLGDPLTFETQNHKDVWIRSGS